MKFAVIPSNGRDCLNDCLDAIAAQVDRIIVIDTGGVYKMLAEQRDIWRFRCDVPNNISHWWNEGLNVAERLAGDAGDDRWDVAVLNDDAIVPEGWFAAVAGNMRQQFAAAGCSGGHNVTWHRAEAVPLDMRMQGFAFVLAGEEKIRANEKLHWYFTDDYIDWESRQVGGMAMVQGFPVEHLYPNGQLNHDLAQLIAQDAQTFVDIYGKRPW